MIYWFLSERYTDVNAVVVYINDAQCDNFNINMSNYYCKYCQEAVIDNWHNSTHTCKKGAYILLNDNGYECLCWATYDVYMCRCTEGCNEENRIDVKGRLIKI